MPMPCRFSARLDWRATFFDVNLCHEGVDFFPESRDHMWVHSLHLLLHLPDKWMLARR